MNTVHRRIWQADRQRETGSQDRLQTEFEVRPTQTHKYMHARTRADTHKKTHKVPLFEKQKDGVRTRENKVAEMGCCLCIFGAGGCMGVTHKHNDSAVGAT